MTNFAPLQQKQLLWRAHCCRRLQALGPQAGFREAAPLICTSTCVRPSPRQTRSSASCAPARPAMAFLHLQQEDNIFYKGNHSISIFTPLQKVRPRFSMLRTCFTCLQRFQLLPQVLQIGPLPSKRTAPQCSNRPPARTAARRWPSLSKGTKTVPSSCNCSTKTWHTAAHHRRC